MRNSCWACIAKRDGVKSRIAFKHTCGRSPEKTRLASEELLKKISELKEKRESEKK